MTPLPRLRDCGNVLLDRLPADEFDPLEPHLRRADLAYKQVVHEYDSEVDSVHFPTTALVSLLTVLEEEDPVETATVGREGMIGVGATLGVGSSQHRAICQKTGATIRVPIGEFLGAMGRGPALPRLVHRYAAFALRSAGQGIACNALHLHEARACRWLLTMHDQAGRDEFPLTQEFLAFMLGMRRQGATVIAGSLQKAGIIAYRRGVVTVLDRPMLEDAACECYATLRAYYDRTVR